MSGSDKKIKAVLFDMGNVLLRFDAKKSSRAFSELLDVPESQLWEAFFISPMEKAYTRGLISTKEFFSQACRSFPNKKIDFETFAHLWNDIFSENPGMDELLERLKKKYPLYLVSNTNELHFGHIKSEFAVLRHFKKCFPSHHVGHRKPDVKMFEHVLRDTGLRPEETVFIDDVVDFVEGAKKAGIHGLHFTDKQALERDLRKLGLEF